MTSGGAPLAGEHRFSGAQMVEFAEELLGLRRDPQALIERLSRMTEPEMPLLESAIAYLDDNGAAPRFDILLRLYALRTRYFYAPCDRVLLPRMDVRDIAQHLWSMSRATEWITRHEATGGLEATAMAALRYNVLPLFTAIVGHPRRDPEVFLRRVVSTIIQSDDPQTLFQRAITAKISAERLIDTMEACCPSMELFDPTRWLEGLYRALPPRNHVRLRDALQRLAIANRLEFGVPLEALQDFLNRLERRVGLQPVAVTHPVMAAP